MLPYIFSVIMTVLLLASFQLVRILYRTDIVAQRNKLTILPLVFVFPYLLTLLADSILQYYLEERDRETSITLT